MATSNLEDPFRGAERMVYDDEYDLGLWVFRPAAERYPGRRPVVVFFFGGGWSGGTPGQFAPHAQYLSSLGMVALCAEYRVKSRNATTPFDAVADAFKVMGWIEGKAGDLQLDLDKVVASGGSAGGHLAATTAVLPDSPDARTEAKIFRPSALVLFNPVVDLFPDPEHYSAEQYETIGGLTARFEASFGERIRDISPMAHVREGLPPTLILHGTDDTTVPFITIEQYRRRCEKFGNVCRVEAYAGQSHAFFNYRDGDNPYFYTTVDAMQQFLMERDYIVETGDPAAFFKD